MKVHLPAQVVVEIRGWIDGVSKDGDGHLQTVKSIAVRHRVLPLSYDLGGLVGLKEDGEVVTISWDDPATVLSVESVRLRDVAIITASERYTFLRTLVPQRTAEAKICPDCAGDGKPLMSGRIPNVVCSCGGLGWRPEYWETEDEPLEGT